MPELLNQVLSIILPALATLIAAWFGYLGTKLKAKYDEQINTDLKKTIVKETVQYVQQVYATLDGPERLQKALAQASTILSEKGITISDTELNMLIESAVYGLKQGISNSNKEQEIQEPTESNKEEAE